MELSDIVLLLVSFASIAAWMVASQSARRLGKVEEELRQVKTRIAARDRRPPPPIAEESSAGATPTPPATPPVAPPPVAVAWRQTATSPESAGPRPVRREPSPFDATLQWLRDQWLLVAGALALQLGIAFGVRHAFTQEWFGPWARVGTSLGAGILLVALAWWPRVARVRPLSEALLAVGFAALYYSAFAAHGFYALVSLTTALAFACGVALVSGVLAGIHNLRFVGHLALFGAYLAPVLFRSGEDRQVALFLYLFVVTAGGLVLAAWRPWATLSPLLATCVLSLETLWAARFHEPDLLVRSLWLHGLLWLELLALPWVRRSPGRLARAMDLGVVILVAGAVAFQILFHCDGGDRHVLAGHLTMGAAVIYGLLALPRPFLAQPYLRRAHFAVAAVLVPVAFAHWFDGTPVTWILAGESIWLAWLAASRARPIAGLGSLGAGTVAGLRVLAEVDRTTDSLGAHFRVTASAVLTAVSLYLALSFLRRRREVPPSSLFLRTADLVTSVAARSAGEILAAAVFVVPLWRYLDVLGEHFEWRSGVFLGALAVLLAGTALGLMRWGLAYQNPERRLLALVLATGSLLASCAMAGVMARATDLGLPVLHLPFFLGMVAVLLVTLNLRGGEAEPNFLERGLRAAVAAVAWLVPLGLLCAEWLRVVHSFAFSDVSGNAGTSMIIASYGVLWLVIALRRRSRQLRWASLSLFAMLVVKMALVDLPALETVWRIAAFLVVGVLLLCGWLVLRRFELVADEDQNEPPAAG